MVGQGRYVALNGTLFGMQLLANDEQTLRNGVKHLADLIDPEPTVERDELLRIAEQMEKSSERRRIRGFARRIREACGK